MFQLEVLFQDTQRLNEALSSFPEIKNDPISYGKIFFKAWIFSNKNIYLIKGFIQSYELVKYMTDQKKAER